MQAFVVGNAAMDKTLAVSALPQPGASILGHEIARDLGGKGVNQAVVLARCGVGVTLLAPVGRDARGTEIADRLRREPLTARLVELDGVTSDASTILQVREGENAVITTNAAAVALTPQVACAAIEAGHPGDMLVLQGNLSAETTAALV
ncbi:PfkB family carbohydrate kinase, partial [Tropicimonas sp. IMCC34043]|uniref:PfkB family carbohydrate kinase n=1 Tax=Tropicimonas sp. IMCC34043 TaxID=2248760 RepID=UPI001E4523B4